MNFGLDWPILTQRSEPFSAEALASRSLISEAEIKELSANEGAKVWESYYLEKIRNGQKFDPKAIRAAVRTSLGTVGRAEPDADTVIAELFKNFSYDELLLQMDFRSDDGPIAYRILAEKHFTKFEQNLRFDIEDDFGSLKRASKSPKPSASHLSWSLLVSGIIDSDAASKVAFLRAALCGLSLHAAPPDRELFRRFARHESDQIRSAAVSGLERVGIPSDADLLLSICEGAKSNLALKAAKVALKLSPGETGTASHLLKSNNPELLKVAIDSLLKCDAKTVWPLIEERLYDEDEQIRKAVCGYAVKRFSLQRLEKLLKSYVSRDRYFYNVVFYLDRVLYAKLPLRRLFRKEIEGFLI